MQNCIWPDSNTQRKKIVTRFTYLFSVYLGGRWETEGLRLCSAWPVPTVIRAWSLLSISVNPFRASQCLSSCCPRKSRYFAPICRKATMPSRRQHGKYWWENGKYMRNMRGRKALPFVNNDQVVSRTSTRERERERERNFLFATALQAYQKGYKPI